MPRKVILLFNRRMIRILNKKQNKSGERASRNPLMIKFCFQLKKSKIAMGN